MSSWGKTDAAGSAPLWATAHVNLDSTSSNVSDLFENNTLPLPYFSDMFVALFNYTSNEVPSGAHQGWVLTKTFTGGRLGRSHHETLVALTSNT